MTLNNKSSLTYLILAIFFCKFHISCNNLEKPVFKTIENIEVNKANFSKVIIQADAVFENPNQMSINLVGTDLEVEGNNINLGKVIQQREIKVNAKNEFSIPIIITFPPQKLWQDQKGLIGGLIDAYLDREVSLRIFGTINMKAAGIPFKLSIDQTRVVKIK